MARNDILKVKGAVRKSVKQIDKRVRGAAVKAMRSIKPIVVREIKNVAAVKDEHISSAPYQSSGHKFSPKGTYSKKDSGPSEAAATLGHSAIHIHKHDGGLIDSLEADAPVVTKNGNTVRMDIGFTDNPPPYAGALFGPDDGRMFHRDPLGELSRDPAFQKKIRNEYAKALKRQVKK